MNTLLKITFTGLPDVDDTINVRCHLKVPPYSEFNRNEVFKAIRLFNGQTKIESTINEQAHTFADTFALDYNGSNDFEISVSDNVVTISCIQSGSFDYFNGCDISGDFATAEFLSPAIAVIGLNEDRYLINNEIWITLSSNVNVTRFNITVQNLSNLQSTGAVAIYPSPNGTSRLDLQPIIKSLFAYPSDANGYVIDDQTVPNTANFKISVTADELETTEITRTFIRGGRKTNYTNQTLPSGALLRPTVLLPIWDGYETAEYYLDDSNVERKRLLVSVNDAVKDYRRTPKSCNLLYVKFLNRTGGYSNWMFESHNETDSAKNLGTFIRDNAVEDFGNESTFKARAIGKVPEYYSQLIAELIVSPEIYLLKDGSYIRVTAANNSFSYDNIKRAYNVSIELEYAYRLNETLLWSN